MVQGTAENADANDGIAARPPPPPAGFPDVLTIANTRDTDLRAHRIALAYYALSVSLDDYLFGPDSVERRNAARVAVGRTEANWFHFALWGTLTVTRNIGQDREPERLAALPDALRRNLTPWVISARASASQEVSRALAWGQRLMFLSISAPFVDLLSRTPDPPRWFGLAALLRLPQDGKLADLQVPIALDLAAEYESDGFGDLPDIDGLRDYGSTHRRALEAFFESLGPEEWEAIASRLLEPPDANNVGAVRPDDPAVKAAIERLLHRLSEVPTDGTETERSLVPLALDWRELSELERLTADQLASVFSHGLIPLAWLLDTPAHWMKVWTLADAADGAVEQAAPRAGDEATEAELSVFQVLEDGRFASRLVDELGRLGCDNLRDSLRAVRLLRPECRDISPTLDKKTLAMLQQQTDWGRPGGEREYSAAVQLRRHRLPIDEAVSWYQLVRRLHRIRRRLEVLFRHLPTQSRHRDRIEQVLNELDTQISRLLLAGTIRLTAVEQDLVNPAVRVTVDHFPTEVAAFAKRQLSTMGEYASGLSAQIASFGLESRFRPIEASMRSLWARFMTDQVFVMALPAETVRLGRDIPPRDFRAPYFPPTLADLEPIDRGIWSETTRCVLDQASRQVRGFDVARDRGRGSAAHDWRRFDERMRFATTLMRTRQNDATLFWAPFVSEDIARIERGELPRRSGHPTDRQINAPLGPVQWFDDDEGYG